MKRERLYRCPECGREEGIVTSDPNRIVTCSSCTDEEGWRMVMNLVEVKSDE